MRGVAKIAAGAALGAALSACTIYDSDVADRGPYVAPITFVKQQLAAEGVEVRATSNAYERSYDLGGGSEAESLVYFEDPMLCGTGGCTLFVLSREAGDWEIIDRISVARLPVYVLGKGRDGWNTLGVSVGGGGMQGGVMAVPHGKDGYADNPTVEPAYRVEPHGAEVLLDER